MNATRSGRGNASDDDEPLDAEVPPTPDEDGPHDVPDEKVIEKTLPSMPARDGGGSSPPQKRS